MNHPHTVAVLPSGPRLSWERPARSVSGHPLWSLAAGLVLLANALPLCAQETLTVLQTGGGQPLVSDQMTLQTGGSVSPSITFDFGFATDEIPAPGVFLDSFTASLQDANSDVAVLATIDASGPTWVPSSPGAVPLSPGEIQFQAMSPPSDSPVFGQGVAYSVLVSVPATFTGSSVTVDFDLFDNQNPNTSALGWFQNLQVVSVPEPPPGLLVFLGLAMLAIKRKFKR